jgi:cell division protein FtsX
MNAPRKSRSDRFVRSRREAKPPGAGARDDERRETLILFVIAILLVANIVLYLCHHNGATSLNDWKPRTEVSARVIVD